MRQLDLNDARTLAVQRAGQRAVKIARVRRNGTAHREWRRLVAMMAKRLKKEIG